MNTRSLQDCYFFYYSTCAKGNQCEFRHEPAALGCETMCAEWQQNKCTNGHCPQRHMQLKKNRKTIPCYWETQPIGCQKVHCAFMHKLPRPEVPNGVQYQVPPEGSAGRHMPPTSEPVIVNFQEMHLY